MSELKQQPNSSGQNWPIKSESAKELVMELVANQVTSFDWAEIKTLRSLVEEHERYRSALEKYADQSNWGNMEGHTGNVDEKVVWCGDWEQDEMQKGFVVADRALYEES